MKKEKLKLVYIEWADAISPEIDWKTYKEAVDWGKNEDYWVSQIGWILEENKKYILISSQANYTKESDQHQFAHIIKIPKTWIRNRQNVKLN